MIVPGHPPDWRVTRRMGSKIPAEVTAAQVDEHPMLDGETMQRSEKGVAALLCAIDNGHRNTQLLLDAPLMAKLKAGKTLVFIIYRTQEVGVGIPISLAGFDQALAGLR